MTDEQERKAFEAWALSEEGGWWPEAIERIGDGYKARAVTKQWQGWKAARANRTASEADARDAARYRWLRHADLDSAREQFWPGGEVPEGDAFDAAIDAAMLAAEAAPK